MSGIETKNNVSVLSEQSNTIDQKAYQMQKHANFLIDLTKKLKSRVRDMEKRQNAQVNDFHAK